MVLMRDCHSRLCECNKERGTIDNPENLHDGRAWLFWGRADQVVPHATVVALASLYRSLGVQEPKLVRGFELIQRRRAWRGGRLGSGMTRSAAMVNPPVQRKQESRPLPKSQWLSGCCPRNPHGRTASEPKGRLESERLWVGRLSPI
jgi:hypothetical protein